MISYFLAVLQVDLADLAEVLLVLVVDFKVLVDFARVLMVVFLVERAVLMAGSKSANLRNENQTAKEPEKRRRMPIMNP